MKMWNKNKNLLIVIGLVGIISACAYFRYATQSVSTMGIATASKTVVIDPGHGGFDPGKKGVNGSHEKEINLQIALKLRDYLEESGAVVIMTRVGDEDLDGMEGKSHKNKDMRQRKDIVNSSEADVVISIHQNSFTQPKVRGAQVFYHSASDKGKILADCIQNSIKKYADPNNTRKVKSTTDYYVLRATNKPAIIVECGFLTNPEEEALLNSKEYQDKMAWSIYLGTVEYFQQLEGK
ncbi:MAG: N-acetylmuramoyl-L-alanine amidase CwlD [Cellulosilyticaceae bacterium]